MNATLTKQVQTALRTLGLYKGAINGRYDAATIRAVKAFQIGNGLTVDGIAGPLTRGVLLPEPMPATMVMDPGVEPAVPQGTGTKWPLQKDCMTFYGGVGVNQTKLVLPFPMRLAWDKKVVIRSFSIHKLVHDSAARVFDGIAKAYTEEQRKEAGLDLFGGCLNVRLMRGGTSYSMHSWGIAIDFDPERNQLKWGRDKARLAKPDCERFWKLWESENWVSLGRARNFDFQHIQAARLG